jgi:hypothetical protein
MNSLGQLNQDNLSGMNKEYEKRTYDNLSSEFQKVHPIAVRAFELIALMNNVKASEIDGLIKRRNIVKL